MTSMICKLILLASLVLPVTIHAPSTASHAWHSGAPPCRASSLRARPDSIEDAAGTQGGNVLFTNRGRAICVLYGVPRVQLYDRRHRHLPVRFLPLHFNMLHQKPVPVYVRPSRQSGISVGWLQWCRGIVYAPVYLAIELPQRGGTVTTNTGPTDGRQRVSPHCYGSPKSPSVVEATSFTQYPLTILTPPPHDGLRVPSLTINLIIPVRARVPSGGPEPK